MGQSLPTWCLVCAILATIVLVAFHKADHFARQPLEQRASASAPAATRTSATEIAANTPKFDVVRIDPDGVSVFAGLATADGARRHSSHCINPHGNGEWAVVLERRFTAGDHQLSLGSKIGEPADGQTVRVTVNALQTVSAVKGSLHLKASRDPSHSITMKVSLRPKAAARLRL